MDKHKQVLGILNIIYGSFGVIAALFLFLIFGGVIGLLHVVARQDPEAILAVPFIGLVGGAIVCTLLISSLPSILTGIGLLKGASWARILLIIVSAIHIFSIPVGTALGIYGLWYALTEPERLSRCTPSDLPPLNI